MRTILVTGAAGFIGSHLAAYFTQQAGTRVIGVDNFCDYYDPNLKKANAKWLSSLGVEILERDLARQEALELPANLDFIVHAAAQPGISAATSFDDYVRNNIHATARLLEQARKLAGLRLFLYLSTSSVYGSPADLPEEVAPAPISAYGVTKLAAEQLALSMHRASRFPVCSCRLFSVYGPRERPDKLVPKLVRAAARQEPFPLHEGSLLHLRSYTFVDDIVAGLAAALDRPEQAAGQIYNIGTDEVHSTADVIQAVEQAFGRPLQHLLLPPRPGDQQTTKARIERARRELAYQPKTTLHEGIQKTITWLHKEREAGTPWAEALGESAG